MNRYFASIVVGGFILAAAGLMLTANDAVAASAKCAAFCDNWCATNFSRKNPTACSQQCQLKHCK
jgi:hypothetical protein